MTNTPPKTHAEVAKKLWKRLIDADVDACNPDCDDQTRGPVAILATALRDAYERGVTIGFDRGQGWAKTREGAMERAGLVFDGEDKIVTRHGTILDDAGNVRRVLGTLPILASGEVVGDVPDTGAKVFFREHDGSVTECHMTLCSQFEAKGEWYVVENDELNGVGRWFSTREAALTAKDAHA